MLAGILVAIIFGIALYIRVALPYDQVFSGEWIKFTGIDVYYHMRIVDNLAHNFPHLNNFDPYFIYPGGGWLGSVHFFEWLLAGIIWVLTLGSPTQHASDVIGVYYPAILGALTVIPVYFIGKALFNRWAGVLAAALIAILPGESIGRSILGFADHDVANTLFTAVAILFLILAIKAARQRQLTFSHLRRRDWAASTKPLVYALIAGIFLGVYLVTWGGALLFVFLITVYLIIQFIIDHLRHESSDYLCIIGVILFLIAMIVIAPFSPSMFYRASLPIAMLIPLVSSGVSWLMASRKLKPAYYPLVLVGIGLAGLGIFYVIYSTLLGLMLGRFSIFAPGGATGATTLEMQNLSFSLAWGNFTTSFFLSLAVLLYLIIYKRAIRRQGSAEENLLLVWSLIILAVTLAQRRFASYFVINVAVLTGYLSWQAIWFAGLRRLVAKPVQVSGRLEPESKRAKPSGQKKARPHLTIYRINVALAIIVIFLFVFLPNIGPTVATATQAKFAPSDAWHSSLVWLRENSPAPFADPDFYYKLYKSPPPKESYDYPESAYGVTAWWDYGYWITRIARRLPSANPSQSPEPVRNVAHLFLSQEEAPTQEIMEKLDSSYIIIDYMTATSKFWAIIIWADRELTEFVDVYHMPYENKLVPVSLFYPEYYRSLFARLYNFDGEAVTPQSPIVVSYEEKIDREGKPYKQITNIEDFPSYEEAIGFIESQESGNHRIVGINPLISPVPLEALRNYKLIHSSDICVAHRDVGMVPEVKIFEYVR